MKNNSSGMSLLSTYFQSRKADHIKLNPSNYENEKSRSNFWTKLLTLGNDVKLSKSDLSFIGGQSSYIEMFGLYFEFSMRDEYFYMVDRYISPYELLILIREFWDEFNRVNIKGFYEETSLTNRFMISFSSHLFSVGYKRKEFGNAELPYTLWYNFIFVNLLKLVLDKIRECQEFEYDKNDIDTSLELEDLLADLSTERVRLTARLDQYIKLQVQKRGITVIQNSYCGFDTEYQKLNEAKHLNFLISAQTAIQRRTIIKVPLYKDFNVSYVHPLNSEVSEIYKNKVDLVNPYIYTFSTSDLIDATKGRRDTNELEIINQSLKFVISQIKNLLNPYLYEFNDLLIQRLQDLVGKDNFYTCDKHDQMVFFFPLSSLDTQIVYPSEGKFSFNDLLEMTKIPDKEFLLEDNFSLTSTTKESVFSSKDHSDLSSEKPVYFTWESKQKIPSGSIPSPTEKGLVIPVSASIADTQGDNVHIGHGTLPIDNTIDSFKGGSSYIPLQHSSDLASISNTNTNTNTNTICINNFNELSIHSQQFISFLSILRDLGLYNNLNSMFQWYNKSRFKTRSRKSLVFNTNTNTNTNTNYNLKVSLSIIKNTFIISHNNASEFSMLQDFEELKMKLAIVGKCFVTLGKPLSFPHSQVYVRDTMLLAPGGKQKLKDLGKLYENEGSFSKIEIDTSDIENMKAFLKRDQQAFEDYAIRDAVITLKHALQMEIFNKDLKQLGIPTTLSSIGRNYVFEQWSTIFKKHLPYQISGEYLMGNANELQTPKGLFASGDVGAHMSYYIANYKGGRNESFMYGVDVNTHWFDYDLVSAYTTGMADIDLPDYHNYEFISIDKLKNWTTEMILDGFLIINTKFVFPTNVKYPSIPCYIDKTTTVYPLSGDAFLTGAEYLLALRQGCSFDIKMAFHIKPKTSYNHANHKNSRLKPFQGIIKDVQAKRRVFAKGHINNLLYKEMGNGIYGNVVRGMSDKKTFDSNTNTMQRVMGTQLSNPIIASWTTAFIRSVIGECLHNIHMLGGKIVSVTTDGFITDLENLEEKLLSLPVDDTTLLRKYRNIRLELSNNPSALEIKSDGKGIISWTTRGQLGIHSKIVAATGFQRLGYVREELVDIFKATLGSDKKYFEFTRNSLRSAKDVFDKGGHVMMTAKDQIFRLFYDNRRRIIDPSGISSWKSSCFDFSNKLMDSLPLLDINDCKTRRFITKFPTTVPFNKNNTNRAKTPYKTNLEIGVRNFIKAYYSLNENYGLKVGEFKYYKDIISFISGYSQTKGIKLSSTSISNLRHRKLIWKPVPRTNENLAFVEYIKQRFPDFKEDQFLKAKVPPTFK